MKALRTGFLAIVLPGGVVILIVAALVHTGRLPKNFWSYTWRDKLTALHNAWLLNFGKIPEDSATATTTATTATTPPPQEPPKSPPSMMFVESGRTA